MSYEKFIRKNRVLKLEKFMDDVVFLKEKWGGLYYCESFFKF